MDTKILATLLTFIDLVFVLVLIKLNDKFGVLRWDIQKQNEEMPWLELISKGVTTKTCRSVDISYEISFDM
jgi:hypothetical protein